MSDKPTPDTEWTSWTPHDNVTPDEIDRQHAHEVMDEKLQWDTGTLSTHTIKRVTADILADMWHDCYRRDQPESMWRKRFTEQVANALYIATGETFKVE